MVDREGPALPREVTDEPLAARSRRHAWSIVKLTVIVTVYFVACALIVLLIVSRGP